ncbi:MAG: YIP1 family protein [Planctomycetota bacterium]|jgi:hypothetical protein
MPCLNHPEITDVVRCESCRAEFCKDCIVEIGGKTLCAMCKDKAVRDFERGDGEATEAEGRGLSPWEDRKRIGFLPAFGQTFKETLFSPTRFFRSISPSERKNDALGYGFIIATLCGLISTASGYLLNLVLFGEEVAGGGGAGAYSLGIGLLLVLIPVQVILSLYISSAIIHLGLLIVRGSKHGFTATFRTQCYAQSANVFSIVPFVGPLVSFIWLVVVAAVGLREMHKTSTGKAVFAVLIFPILLGILVLLLALAVGLLPVLLQSLKR